MWCLFRSLCVKATAEAWPAAQGLCSPPSELAGADRALSPVLWHPIAIFSFLLGPLTRAGSCPTYPAVLGVPESQVQAHSSSPVFSQHSWGAGKWALQTHPSTGGRGKQTQGAVLSRVSLSTISCQFIRLLWALLSHFHASSLQPWKSPLRLEKLDVVTAAFGVVVGRGLKFYN